MTSILRKERIKKQHNIWKLVECITVDHESANLCYIRVLYRNENAEMKKNTYKLTKLLQSAVKVTGFSSQIILNIKSKSSLESHKIIE